MAHAVSCEGVNTDCERATEESVMELLQQHFSELSSAAERLFQPGAKDFGIFDYTARVSDLCGRLGTWENSEHDLAVVWVEAAFLMVQKLIQTANTLDAALSIKSPKKIDYAILYRYCGAGKSSPTRASSPLTITDIQLVYLEGMKLLVKHKLYEAYTGMIRVFSGETLTTSSASVAVHAVIGVASVACSAFSKAGDAMFEVPVPPGHTTGDTPFPKEDVSHDLLQTITGPLYGHMPNAGAGTGMVGNVYTEDGEIDWPGTLAKNEENMIWLIDWDVDGLCTDAVSATARDICDKASSVTSVSVGATQGPPRTKGEESKLEQSSAQPLTAEDKQASTDKIRLSCLMLRWDTDTESALTIGRGRKLAQHTGWACGLPEMVREIVVATVSYYAYGLFATGNFADFETLWSEFASYIGAMIRGYIIDHDTEADIGEHNVYNWLCKTCASASTELQITVDKVPMRTAHTQRVSWATQTYFFYGRRHCGLARRVYSRKFRSLPGVQWGVTQCSDFLEPLAAPEGPFRFLGAVIQHILRLTGITVDDTSLSRMCAAMPDPVNPVKAGMCANCRVDGVGLEMMIYGIGIMIMAALLPESARRKFVWEMDGYGGRALPTLYSRILSGCRCSAFWMEEVQLLGYRVSFSTCGADSCDDDNIVVEPIAKDAGREWTKTPRVRENLKNLTAACKVEFESMPTIRDQLKSGRLDPSWCYLSCAGRVKAILARESSE